MKVHELISELLQYDQDRTVRFVYDVCYDECDNRSTDSTQRFNMGNNEGYFYKRNKKGEMDHTYTEKYLDIFLD